MSRSRTAFRRRLTSISRTLTLTPAAELLRSRASRLFDEAVALSSLVREHGNVKLVELRFGMVDSFATAVGPALIKSMLSESLNLALCSDITPRLREGLEDKRFDIVVANDAFADEARFTRIPLMREPHVLVLPRNADWDVLADDLRALARARPMVRYHPPSYWATQVDVRFHRMNVQLSRRVLVDTSEKLLAMVAAAIGWTIATPLALLRSKNVTELVRVLPFPGVNRFIASSSWCPAVASLMTLRSVWRRPPGKCLPDRSSTKFTRLLPGMWDAATIPESYPCE